MRDLPPLNALRAFEAAARHGSFRAAAEELHVTPTAISHQIRHLEDLLGCALFRRRPRPMRLTAAGQRLFPPLRDGLDRISAGVAAVRTPAAAGPLVITTTRAFASRWLIPRLGELRQACDGRELAVHTSEEVIDLHAGGADLAIRYTRAPAPDLECRRLFCDRYLPVCSPALISDRYLAGGPADLTDCTLIHFDWKLPDPEAPTWNLWLRHAREAFPDAALPNPDTGIHFSEEMHAIEAALLGQGIALVSDTLIERELTSGLLAPAIDFSIPGLTFYAMYAKAASQHTEIEGLVNFILEKYS